MKKQKKLTTYWKTITQTTSHRMHIKMTELQINKLVEIQHVCTDLLFACACVCGCKRERQRESLSSKECYIQFSTKIIEKLNQQRIKSSYKPLEVSKKPSKLINLSSDSSQKRTNFTRKSVTLQFLGFVLDKHFRKPSKLINLSTDSSQKTEHQFHKKNPLGCSFQNLNWINTFENYTLIVFLQKKLIFENLTTFNVYENNFKNQASF